MCVRRREACYLLLAAGAGAGREEGLLICPGGADTAQESGWEKCKTNPARISGLPTDQGAPIYTDPLPPDAPPPPPPPPWNKSAALICLDAPLLHRRTDSVENGSGSSLGQRSRTTSDKPLDLQS